MLKYILILILSFASLGAKASTPSPRISGLHYSPNPVTVGSSQTFGFSYSNATKCYSGSVVYYSGPMSSGYYSVGTPVRTSPGSWGFTVTCTNDSGQTDSAYISNQIINPPRPSAYLWWSPSTVDYGDASTLYWSSSDAHSCVLNGNSVGTSGSSREYNNTSNRSASMYCSGPGGSSSTSSSTLQVNPLPSPTISNARYSPNPVEVGNTQTFSFNYTNASKCYSGSVVYYNGAMSSGTYTVQTPTRTTAESYGFTVTCTNASGKTANMYVSNQVVNPPVPTASLNWSPSRVSYGGSSTLSWSSSEATQCVLNGNTVGTSGSTTVENNTSNNSSSLYCTGRGGSSSTVSSVLSVDPPPQPAIAELKYLPNPVLVGNSQTFSFNYSNAFKCYAPAPDGNSLIYYVGSENNTSLLSGTYSIDTGVRTKAEEYEFTVSCENSAGTSQMLVQNKISEPVPAPTLSQPIYTPSKAFVGETQTFSFEYSNASRCYAPAHGDISEINYVTDTSSTESKSYSVSTGERTEVGSWSFDVVCSNESGEQVTKNVSTEVFPTEQSITAPSYQDGSVSLSWSEVAGVSYKLERFYDNNWQSLGILDTTTYDDTELNDKATYVYRVSNCIDASHCAAPATTGDIYPKPSITDLKYTPAVGFVGEAQAFSFVYSNVTKCHAPAPDGNSLIYYVGSETSTELVSGTHNIDPLTRTETGSWSFDVTCTNASNETSTQSVSTTIYPKSGSVSVPNFHEGSVTITWDDAGAVKYKLERFDGEVWAPLGFVTVPTFTDSGLDQNSTFKYRVSSCASEQECSSPVTSSAITPPSTLSLTDLKYIPETTYIGQTQTFTFKYTGASECYAPATQELDAVYYVGSPGSTEVNSETITYSITTEIRTKADSWSFDVICKNPDGDEVTLPISNTVQDSGLSVSGTPEPTATVAKEYVFTPEVTKLETEQVTFTIENQPEWASFDPATGELRGTPSQEHVKTYSGIAITVTDGKGKAFIAPFNIEVLSGGKAITIRTELLGSPVNGQ